MDAIEMARGGVRVGDIACALHINPTVITRAFYLGHIPAEIADRCPVIGNKRTIPPELIPQILDILRDRGYIRSAVPTIQ